METNSTTAKGTTTYINRREGREVETVDEFPANTQEERKYANQMLAEYQTSDRSAEYYRSSRACKGWND